MSGGSYNYPASWADLDASLYDVTSWRSIASELREQCPDAPGCVEYCAELDAYIDRADRMLEDFANLKEPLRAVDFLCSGDIVIEEVATVLADWKPAKHHPSIAGGLALRWKLAVEIDDTDLALVMTAVEYTQRSLRQELRELDDATSSAGVGEEDREGYRLQIQTRLQGMGAGRDAIIDAFTKAARVSA